MTHAVPHTLLGRDAEMLAVHGLIELACAGQSGALVLVGSAGAGKTTILRESEHLATAENPAFVVLRARGIESEAEVAFGGLLELVRPVAELIPQLPQPQATALQGALALAAGGETDRFSVSAATLAMLGLAAANGPVLVIIDDLHWIDPPSAQAILFAARRLWGEGVAVLLSTRTDGLEPGYLEGIPALEVGPLGSAEAARLARSVAQRDLDDEEVDALFVGTGGNPLAIVEATRSLGSTGDALEGIILPLPVAERIRVGVERRLAQLTPDERRAALVAAAAGTQSSSMVVGAALVHDGLSLEALDAAERARILRIQGGTIEFEHPLTRSAVYAAATSKDQRRAHRALAVASPEASAERAWHLAAATVDADETAAAALERAGNDAIARGAPSTAVRAYERAAALSERPSEAARRLLACASAARMSGMIERARDAIAQALERTSDPLVRADALTLLFQMDAWRAPVATVRSISAEAARIDELDPVRSARLLAEASTALLRSADIGKGVELAERAQAGIRAQGLTDDTVDFALLFARIMNARAPEVVDDLRVLGERLVLAPPGAQTLALLQQIALLQTWIEQYESASPLIEHAITVGRTQAPGTLPLALSTRAELGYRRGRWRVALADTTESASLAGAFDQAHARGLALTCQARIEACLGREDECRASAAEAAEIGIRLGGDGSPISAWGAPALGLLELGRRHLEAAIPHFELLVTSFEHGGIREPGVVMSAGDLIECYARSDRRAEAEDRLATFESVARQTERVGALAIAARCWGILADDADFAAHFDEATRLHGRVDQPFEQARTVLCFGERLRRARRRADARVQLRAALEMFERLGARDWAHAASDELRVTGETAASRSGAPSDELTPQELQVALMVASGATNREAASRLFLSAKTIEAHLGRIYRKLGVRSRTELAARVAGEGITSPPA